MKTFLKQAWFELRTHSFKLIGGLFMEIKDGQNTISLTRTLTVAISTHCLYAWHQIMFHMPTAVEGVKTAIEAVKDIPPSELYILSGLLSIAGVKVVGTQVSNVMSAKGGGEP